MAKKTSVKVFCAGTSDRRHRKEIFRTSRSAVHTASARSPPPRRPPRRSGAPAPPRRPPHPSAAVARPRPPCQTIPWFAEWRQPLASLEPPHGTRRSSPYRSGDPTSSPPSSPPSQRRPPSVALPSYVGGPCPRAESRRNHDQHRVETCHTPVAASSIVRIARTRPVAVAPPHRCKNAYILTNLTRVSLSRTDVSGHQQGEEWRCCDRARRQTTALLSCRVPTQDSPAGGTWWNLSCQMEKTRPT